MTPPREPKRWWLVCGLAAAATVVALFVWLGAASWIRAWPPYDIERVHGSLRSLELPYQSVRTEYYWDGGSVGIEITDRDGKRGAFCLPAPLGETNRYARVFVGATHYREPGAVEILEPEHTKRMLIQVLATMPNRNADDDHCLMVLRRQPADYVRALLRNGRKWCASLLQ